MPSLRDPKLYLGRARDHLETLDCKAIRFEKAHKLELSTEEDLNEQLYIVRAKLEFTPEESFDIALTCADAVFALRASLDHLAWQLALHTTQSPGSNLSFPICEKNSLDTQVKIAKETFGIPDEAISIMKSFQPYLAGDLFKTHHLWRLSKLCNIAKHRHIPGHGGASEPFFFVPPDVAPHVKMLPGRFESEQVVTVPLASKDKVTLKPNAAIKFSFFDEAWELTVDDLFEMHQFVADTVFPSFAGFFK